MGGDAYGRLLDAPPDLPVVAGLPALLAAVRSGGAAVLQAPPGTGKTTLVPPALTALGPGLVLVTQPRRIAARAAARRLAGLLGQPVGAGAGYSVRGERRTGLSTRVEFVTTGVLLRRLQRDPELPGVLAVVLDEVHERHLDADLAMALLVDVRANLRELPLVAMSATVEAGRTARLLTGAGARPVPVVTVEGSLHPVTRHLRPPPPRVERTDGRGVTPGFLDHVADVVREALRVDVGDVLVFVPGVGEIDGLVQRLGGDLKVDVRPLHGRLTPREQDLALTAGPRRRVVVSTAVAESSLTVPGVRVVVDAGLARQPRTDHRRGLAGLVTVGVSRSSADQRAGRAGREGPGAAYACWSTVEDARLAPHPQPEIATADLTAFALELACWGSPGGVGLALLDAPPDAALAAAVTTLRGLGAVHPDGTVTDRGRRIAAVGADPRLARALLDGAALVGAHRAAEVVALLADDARAPGGDLVAALRAARRAPSGSPWAGETRRLLGALGHRGPTDGSEGLGDDLAVGLVTALAHPDRIARRRPGGSAYLMTSGTGAVLPPAAAGLGGLAWLAIADADRGTGRADATVRSAAPLDEGLALLAAPALLVEHDEVRWERSAVAARRVTRLGAIELARAPLPHPPADLVAAAVRTGLAAEGLAALPWPASATALRERMRFVHGALGEPWPDVSDAALLAGLADWLGPELDRVRTTRDLRRVPTLAALRRLLPWPQAARLDDLAPERVTVPSGSAVRVDYASDPPVLAVRVQEVFGWSTTPRLADGRVPLLLHLLSPARRPVAVTSDLESFWHGGYQQVRGELRGRYPKHSWPPDPWAAVPTTGARRGGQTPKS